MRSDFLSFLRAFWGRWLALVSGGLGVPLTAAAVLWPNHSWAPLLALIGAVGIVVAAYLIWKPERDALIQATQALIPDWPIHDALFCLCPDIIADPSLEKWETIGNKLIDMLSTMQIVSWGREIRGSERGALKLIEFAFWEQSKFSYWFLEKGHERVMHVDSTDRRIGRQFADLHFNKAQLMRMWNQSN